MKHFYFLLLVTFWVLSVNGQTQDLYDVARTGTVEQAKQLLLANPQLVNTPNPDGYTPLILASYRANNAVAKFLLQSGANIDAVSGMGTALMASVVKGN